MMMMHMSLWLKLIFFPSIFLFSFFSAISLVSHQNALCFFFYFTSTSKRKCNFSIKMSEIIFFPGCGNENENFLLHFFCSKCLWWNHFHVKTYFYVCLKNISAKNMKMNAMFQHVWIFDYWCVYRCGKRSFVN